MKNTCFVLTELLCWNILILPATTLAAEWPTFPPSVTAPSLTKVPGIFGSAPESEASPIVFQQEPLLLRCHRPTVPGNQLKTTDLYLTIVNLKTGAEVASPFAYGFSMGCAVVIDNKVNVFASKIINGSGSDIYRFTSADLVHWSEPALAVGRSGSELLWNSSVTRGPNGYVMAYESNQPVGFCFKFAQSTDLVNWNKINVPTFAGPKGNEYSACPDLDYVNGYYYVTYLAQGTVLGSQNGFVTEIARSKDLTTWEFSDKNPMLTPSAGEGINNSDVDLFEYNNKTYVFYCSGDQQSWGNIQLAVYGGTPGQLLSSYFPPESVPEPHSRILLMSGLIGIVLVSALRKRKWYALLNGGNNASH
jgi:hypothetical protein